jgi:hypothetical protein
MCTAHNECNLLSPHFGSPFQSRGLLQILRQALGCSQRSAVDGVGGAQQYSQVGQLASCKARQRVGHITEVCSTVTSGDSTLQCSLQTCVHALMRHQALMRQCSMHVHEPTAVTARTSLSFAQ